MTFSQVLAAAWIQCGRLCRFLQFSALLFHCLLNSGNNASFTGVVVRLSSLFVKRFEMLQWKVLCKWKALLSLATFLEKVIAKQPEEPWDSTNLYGTSQPSFQGGDIT